MGIFSWFKRRRLSRRPFPQEWVGILERDVPFFAVASEQERRRIMDLVKVFVWDKTFVPAGGMEITDRVKVVVAASAVRLVIHLDLSYYDRLTEIVVYPEPFRRPGEDGAVILGEAHDWGTVVLAWSAVLEGLANQRDGHDTAIHEFAHVLDRADGMFDGTPVLRARGDLKPWADVMGRHFLALARGERSVSAVLRDYGALNEAEFFAVATEAFFERPDLLRARAPELYRELAAFYLGRRG